jgi:hypothetical protein
VQLPRRSAAERTEPERFSVVTAKAGLTRWPAFATLFTMKSGMHDSLGLRGNRATPCRPFHFGGLSMDPHPVQ